MEHRALLWEFGIVMNWGLATIVPAKGNIRSDIQIHVRKGVQMGPSQMMRGVPKLQFWSRYIRLRVTKSRRHSGVS